MVKFKAENCKNFNSTRYMLPEEQVILHLCTTENCADRDNCDGEIREKIPTVHFEPLLSIEEQMEVARKNA